MEQLPVPVQALLQPKNRHFKAATEMVNGGDPPLQFRQSLRQMCKSAKGIRRD
jgi:hypothetical protein